MAAALIGAAEQRFTRAGYGLVTVDHQPALDDFYRHHGYTIGDALLIHLPQQRLIGMTTDDTRMSAKPLHRRSGSPPSPALPTGSSPACCPAPPSRPTPCSTAPASGTDDRPPAGPGFFDRRARPHQQEPPLPPHLHIAERCIHGETKRILCDHHVVWSRYRVREVPCLPSFCKPPAESGPREARTADRD
ncbi:hypothetical protein ACIQC7_18460 [Kitasatospora sp. NPDC088556]|uniref:hypothetical protein n=1 Tax=Kitasatospora sp. NPDC088556 TaxID=3364076 RepID=UPI003807C38D